MLDFFIKKPRFAAVISIVLVVASLPALLTLPIADYPEVTPPQIVVKTDYPGASASIVAQTVAAPLEEEINGVDDMIYMSSTCDDTGHYELTITFKIGTDRNIARMNVQNKVQQAQSQLPQAVIDQGIDITTESGSMLAVLVFHSPKGTYNQNGLADYVHSYVKNSLKRIPGVGSVDVLGPEVCMRVWMDFARLKAFGLSPDDVAAAIQAQNIQATLGRVGAAPGNEDMPMTFSLQAQGRLNEAKDFENIIVRSDANGGLVRLKDIARVEIGNDIYSIVSDLNGKCSLGVMLKRTPGMNALDAMAGVRQEMDRLSKQFPEDLEGFVFTDMTDFIHASISEVVEALLMTFVIVAIVCYVFLQDWRAALVPVLAIPVSVLATFLILAAFGYSINLLTMFALVLSIGVVVDNAIVLVERVIYLMEQRGMDSKMATFQAMKDVTSAIVASTLVLLAMFVPIAFLAGITGCIYRQFSVAISASIVFSMLVALTLGPALCSTLLRLPKPKTRGPLAWFNSVLNSSRNVYVSTSMWVARRVGVTFILLAVVVGLSWSVLSKIPNAFILPEDQGVIFLDVKLHEGSSLPQTKNVLAGIESRILKIPGIKGVQTACGFSLIGGRSENVALSIIKLQDWSLRKKADEQIDAIMQKIRMSTSGIIGAEINAFTPPPIQGLGTVGGLDFRLQALKDIDPQKLQSVLEKLLIKLNQCPQLKYAFTTCSADTPHLYLDVNREKAQSMNVPVAAIFGTLQSYLGMRYVNDINRGSQVKDVYIAADWNYRKSIEDIKNLYVKSMTGDMVPMESLVTISVKLAPRTEKRYNLYPSVEITADAAPGISSGQAMAAMEKIAGEVLPDGYSYDWSGMSYQEKKTGNQMILMAGLSLIFGYLFLVAQYESWIIPIPIILSLFAAIFGSVIGLKLTGMSMSIYAQLGVVMLLGVVSKNGILIVEFSKNQREMGNSILESAATGAHERFRAVLMTAFAFILGVLPMVFATGAGANSRQALGITIFAGMLAATTLGMIKIPALYVPFQKLRERKPKAIEPSVDVIEG
jgi:hydrophobe/amphiphile efflux-1 (HAE1) family protein